MTDTKFSFSQIQLDENREALALVLSDTSMLRFMDLPHWSDPVALMQLLQACENGTACMFLIFRNGFPCGITGLSLICLKHRFAYLTIGVLPNFQGKQIGEKAIAIAEKIAFNELGLKRIEAQVHENNTKAINLFTKHNFVIEGRMRKNFLVNDVFSDSIVFSKLDSDMAFQ